MAKPIPLRFSVLPENEAAAIAHLAARGYSPVAIEEDDDGLIILIFKPLPDDQLYELFLALPAHLSAKIGMVMDGPQPLSLRHDH